MNITLNIPLAVANAVLSSLRETVVSAQNAGMLIEQQVQAQLNLPNPPTAADAPQGLGQVGTGDIPGP